MNKILKGALAFVALVFAGTELWAGTNVMVGKAASKDGPS